MFGFFEKKEAHVDEVKAPAFVEWKGWRKFKVMNRKQECVDTTTFTLMPADWHFATASGTSGRIGSLMAKMPEKVSPPSFTSSAGSVDAPSGTSL